MLAVKTLFLAAVLAADPGRAVLMEFTSAGCPSCRSMEPVVAQLAQAGYPIEQINVDERPEVARHYRVSQIPCFVVAIDGQEKNRRVGMASAVELAEMFRQAVLARAHEPVPDFRGQSPDKPPSVISSALDSIGRRFDQPATPDARAAALAASVRLKVEDDTGHSFGTGTIIDTHGDEALVLTCGHLFRNRQGHDGITVDLFSGTQMRTVAGQLIGYDADTRDVALVAIRPGVAVTPIRVAAPGHPIASGTRIFSIGCDEGRAPTVRDSQVSAVDRYAGPSNYEIVGQPVDGRSGGGLFTEDGALVGICNAADPSENRGIYAGLPVVHWQLDQIGQSRIYLAQLDATPPPAAAPRGDARDDFLSEPGVDGLATASPPANRPPLTPVVRAPSAAEDERPTELICILSSPDGTSSRIVVLDDPSPELLHQIHAESRDGQSRHLAETADARPPIVRAQSR